jgi:acetyl esterase/lipase
MRPATGLALLAVIVSSASLTRAAEPKDPKPIPIWPGLAPGEKADAPPEKSQTGKNDDIIRVSDVSQPTISVYRPKKDIDTGAAVMICPGGGYNILAWNLEGTEVAKWLNSIGVTGIVLKYRVPARKGQPRHEAALQDAQRALGLIRHRAAEWNLDPKRIGVLGFSAGGHLSATLSNQYEKRTYEPVDDADKVSCRPDFTLLIYPAYLVSADNKLVPELKVTDQTPRTFLLMTQDDAVRVECAVYYYLALKGAKVPAELHVYPVGGHGYGLRPSKNEVSTWPKRAEQWLRAIGVLTRAK